MQMFGNIPIPSVITIDDRRAVVQGVVKRDQMKTQGQFINMADKYNADDFMIVKQDEVEWVMFMQTIEDAIILEEYQVEMKLLTQ